MSIVERPSDQVQVGGVALEGLLETLVERASRPLERALSLPAELYTSPEVYELELERIWRRSWIHVGRVEQLEKPGDWISREIAGEPLVVTRGQDGEIHALSRVCRHRFMDVLDGVDGRCGHAERFTCPYHRWSYQLDGSLASAPHMTRNELFAPCREAGELGLVSFPVDTWHGFVFVNLDRDAMPLSATFNADVERLMGNYDGADWRRVGTIEWGETNVNWKFVAENAREAYHSVGVHADSLEPLWPAHMIQFEPSPTSDYWFARMFVSDEAAVGREEGHNISPMALPPAPGLTPYERSYSAILGVYPQFVYLMGPDVSFTLSFVPTGVSTHVLDIDVLLHKDHLDHPDAKAATEEAIEFFNVVQSEDARAIAGTQRMMSSQLPNEGGPLSHMEVAIMTFQRYLAKRLVGEDRLPTLAS